MTDFVLKSAAMKKMQATLREFVGGRVAAAAAPRQTASHKLHDCQKAWVELDTIRPHTCDGPVPEELKYLSMGRIEFLTNCSLSIGDYLKTSLESYGGEPWNWWPFDPP